MENQPKMTVAEATEVGVTKKGDGTEKYPDFPSTPGTLIPKLELYYQFDNDEPIKFGESANPTVMIGFHPDIRTELRYRDKKTGKLFRMFAKKVS